MDCISTNQLLLHSWPCNSSCGFQSKFETCSAILGCLRNVCPCMFARKKWDCWRVQEISLELLNSHSDKCQVSSTLKKKYCLAPIIGASDTFGPSRYWIESTICDKLMHGSIFFLRVHSPWCQWEEQSEVIIPIFYVLFNDFLIIIERESSLL